MAAWAGNRAFAGLAAALACAACRNTGSAESQIPEEPVSYESRDPIGTSSSDIDDAVTRSTAPAGSVRTHVVQRGDTLYELARRYYNNDQSKWRKIYQANVSAIPNKDLLRVGQELVIPD
jgi:nucleoid-associated protein YgaU